jgi:hypothetical protein
MYTVKRSGRNGYAVVGAAGPHHARPRRPVADLSARPVADLSARPVAMAVARLA